MRNLFHGIISSIILLSFSTQIVFAKTQINRIVAVVNEQVVLASELETMASYIKEQLISQNTKIPDYNSFQQQFLEKLINEKLQLQIAANKGIKVDDEEVNRYIKLLASKSNFTIQEFHDVIKRWY